MPPVLALIFSILFSLYLFKTDSKRTPRMSNALWLTTIWYLILSTKPVTVWFGGRSTFANVSSTDVYLEGSKVDAAIFLVLIVTALVILSLRGIQLSKFIGNNPWLFVYLLYCGISTLWSDYTFVSFKRWIKEIGNVSMVLIVLTEQHPVEAFKTLFRRCAYVVIPLSIVLIKYFPDLGRTYTQRGELMLTGATLHKNSLGILCAVLFIYFIWDYKNWRKSNTPFEKKNKFNHVILLLMMSWLVYKANSATAIMCSIIGVGIVVGMDTQSIKRNVKNVGGYIIAALLIVLFIDYAVDIRGLIFSNLGRDETLTGRTQVWDQVLAIGTNPLIGTGYDSFWLGDRIQKFWDEYWWQPNQAHNGYLETYINLGWIGVFLLGAIILSAYRKIMRQFTQDYDYHKVRMSLFVVALTANLTEAYFKGICQMWFVFLLIVVGYPRPAVSSDRQYSGMHQQAGVLN